MAGLFTFSPRLHVYHLAVVQLEYKADVSVSPADVDGDVQEWQKPESRMRLWRLRVDLQPWLSVECGVLPQKTSASFPDEYSYNQGVKAQSAAVCSSWTRNRRRKGEEYGGRGM